LGCGREVFFHFPLLPMSFHQIPNGFPSRSQIVPHVLTMFPIMPFFILYANVVLLSP
jgi:hypothetical protein